MATHISFQSSFKAHANNSKPKKYGNPHILSKADKNKGKPKNWQPLNISKAHTNNSKSKKGNLHIIFKISKLTKTSPNQKKATPKSFEF